jgi:4-hydroxybenzoyl-CoA reductase subunit beta
MLRLPPFELRRPTTLAEAAAILTGEGAGEGAGHGAGRPAGATLQAARVRPVAGGTDLWPNMKRRHQSAEVVVALSGIAELRGVRATGEVRIGATTTLAEVASHPAVRERFPALARAVESISSPPLRNMGTIGGNVCVDTRCTYYNQTEEWRRSIDYCMKEAGTICWVAPSSPRCWAHAASDSAPMLAALGARVRLVSAAGERTIEVADLYRDDGIDYLAKRPEELVAEVLVPASAGREHLASSFWKLRRRGSIDFAVLSVAAAVRTGAGGEVTEARIYLGAVSSRPAAAEQAAAALLGKPLTAESIAEAAKLARRDATPMDNTDFQAQWRGAVVPKYVEAALRECAGLPVERMAPNHS